jgi:hypothetical protein
MSDSFGVTKSEIRISKHETISKFKYQNSKLYLVWNTEILKIRICFGFRLPSPTYLRPPKRGLRVGGSGFAQAGASDFEFGTNRLYLWVKIGVGDGQEF